MTSSTQHGEPKKKNQADERNTFKAGQGVHNTIVKPGQAVRQLIVPLLHMTDVGASEASVKGTAQVLQVRSDDPQSTGGVGGDLELWKRGPTMAVAFRAGHSYNLKGR